VNVLMTGATGFVGSAVAHQMIASGEYDVVAAVRRESNVLPNKVRQVVTGDLLPNTDWNQALRGVNVVIHLAARVHVMEDDAADPLAEFRNVNSEGSLNLARQAAQAGVKRFIFMSSIKVNGEQTTGGSLFTPNDTYMTTDPYGQSKLEAEQGLVVLAKETGMEVVIIRPPLIYGPDVKANFRQLLKFTKLGIPLPLGGVQNKRSLVALDNLVNFIIHSMTHPKAANEVFLISDGEDVSTTELLEKIAKAFGKKPRLLPIPTGFMTLAAKLLGKGSVAGRLFGSLQVDSSKARELLDWKPVITMDEQLKKTVESYNNETSV